MYSICIVFATLCESYHVDTICTVCVYSVQYSVHFTVCVILYSVKCMYTVYGVCIQCTVYVYGVQCTHTVYSEHYLYPHTGEGCGGEWV